MTELTCWPLDNKPYTSVALGAAYAARSRGVLNADSFTATTNGDNTITVGKGVGCIHVTEQWAAFPLNEGDVLLTFADADGVYQRWDVIALVYDKNANTAGLEVRTGLAAETPALPALRRNDDYDEIFLYRVTRPVGATKITADNVVDLRLDGAVCGLMRDTIDAIDTSVMQEQFDTFLQKITDDLNDLEMDKIPTMWVVASSTFMVDDWEEADGKYVQTRTMPKTSPKGAFEPKNILPPMTSHTDVAATDATKRRNLGYIARGKTEITVASTSITMKVATDTKPDCDLDVYWYLER